MSKHPGKTLVVLGGATLLWLSGCLASFPEDDQGAWPAPSDHPGELAWAPEKDGMSDGSDGAEDLGWPDSSDDDAEDGGWNGEADPLDESDEDLPEYFDWRQIDGDYTTPARSQNIDDETCSSCWAFASVAVIESMLKIEADDPEWDLDLSEQMILAGTDGGCEPDAVATALDYAAEEGIPEEWCLPYEATDDVSVDEACEEADDSVWTIGGWRAIEGGDDAIKDAVLDGPVVAKMTLYSDFYRYDGGIYEPSAIAHSSGAKHFVVIVGWDDESGVWIAKNSYGTDWGEDTYDATGKKGWFRIPYGVCDIGESAFAVDSVDGWLPSDE